MQGPNPWAKILASCCPEYETAMAGKMCGYYYSFLAPLEDLMCNKSKGARSKGGIASMKIMAEDVATWASSCDSAGASKLERALCLLQDLIRAELVVPDQRGHILGSTRRQIPSSEGTMTSPRVSCAY